jgi:hypothetical protein
MPLALHELPARQSKSYGRNNLKKLGKVLRFSADSVGSMTTVSHTDRVAATEWISGCDSEALTIPTAQAENLNRIAVTWQTALDFFVPIGYEDESGFHYGTMASSTAAISLSNEAA